MIRYAIFLLLTIILVIPAFGSGKTVTKYFEGSDYELVVYEIKGRRDGNTMFILGGIQGDEPGGYLSADLYVDMKLEQGNLIVIPRANLKSVVLFDRGPDGDMNRLFLDEVKDPDPADEVVAVIMKYMGKADIFLNLHDGWGYHSDIYINSKRNPNRFGQSVIVDENQYTCDDGTRIDLKSMAESALENINAKIADKDHHLAYFNTNTGNPDGNFKGMQKTATWYALRKHCIPAFGIESSKDLNSLEDKVLYHNYAVNEFMKQMDIIPETPPLFIIPAVLEEVVLLVDGVAVKATDNSTVYISKGAKVKILDVVSNHSRGVTCDMVGLGNYNDMGKEFTIYHDTRIKFRKEDAIFANVYLELDPAPVQPAVFNVPQGYHIQVSVDGSDLFVPNGGSFHVNYSSVVVLKKFASGKRDINLPINLKGWVPVNEEVNIGDDRGYNIVIGDNLIKRFSVNGEGKIYPVTVNNINNKEITRIFMVIND